MKLNVTCLAKIMPCLHEILPEKKVDDLWKEAQPKGYHYKIQMARLPQVLMGAFVRRMSSTTAILQCWGGVVGTYAKATLSDALRRSCLVELLHLMRQRVEETFLVHEGDLVAIDTMPVTLPRTRRSDAKKFNDKTIGCGFLWAFNINAVQGRCPIKLLALAQGSWSDMGLMLTAKLPATGATYLFDRGFFCFKLLRLWLSNRVYFIVRAKKRNIKIRQIVCRCGRSRRVGRVKVSCDAVVTLAESNPIKVRLVKGTLASGEDLILVSSHFDWTAEQLLEAYDKRWQIERFHNLLKDAIGLAHLYSFQQIGIEVLVHIALMLATLIWMSLDGSRSSKRTLVQQIRQALNQIRRQLDIPTLWKRNISVRSYRKKDKEVA